MSTTTTRSSPSVPRGVHLTNDQIHVISLLCSTKLRILLTATTLRAFHHQAAVEEDEQDLNSEKLELAWRCIKLDQLPSEMDGLERDRVDSQWKRKWLEALTHRQPSERSPVFW
ncbi:hypothetical protein ST47_g3044 [Ascochyta rabiei]|uniref:Uncharacterized protein n=1 Tax=Didymella rabiei TaxID=5454 RepID=A0A163IMJ6_DIDRA|nr:hypothetical protein ST47_g3044 [Ascochyta rabiei]